MVRQQIVRVRRLVTLHLALLAFLTATLVAAGTDSAFLPLLVLMIGISSLLFVDWLEWFSLHHTLAYAGMVLGTLLALGDYFRNSGGDSSAQLYSIATLLIYPEIVIMLQRKSMRLFEQMAVFLLLEIIVAALINDNVLFGFLLAPIVLLWVSALLLLTRYSTLIQLAPDLDRPTPRLVELIAEAWRKAVQNRYPPVERMLEVIQPDRPQRDQPRRPIVVSPAISIGLMSLVFAGLYFYLLPRSTLNATPYSSAPRTGFSETLSLGSMGKLLQDSAPVLHLSLFTAGTNQPYRLVEPPYIRGVVVSRYNRQTRSATFESRDQMVSVPSDRFEALSALGYLDADVAGDRVDARFDIISPDAAVLPSIAPMLNHDRKSGFVQILPFEWRTINGRSDFFPGSHKQSYTLLTSGFRNGQEWPVLPDSRQIFNRPRRNATEALLGSLAVLSDDRGEYDRRWIDDLVERMRSRTSVSNARVAFAQAAEEYLSASGEFTYSLDLRSVSDPDLDPIEDFVVNQKRGHCQYFAAALTMILRHHQIPTRIVLGYHPLEYNELGDYFTVRKSDAHAWVESYFTADELKVAGLYTPDLGETGGWLRLDPTPAGQGSNAGTQLRPQEGQGLDFVSRYWSEWVLNSRQRAEDNSLYEPLQESTRRTYTGLMAMAREMIQRAKDSQFIGGAIDRDNWFSWPLALMIMTIGGLVVTLWKLLRWFPRWAPRLASKLGLRKSNENVRQHFFHQCLRLLARAGFTRRIGQTASEFTQEAGDRLQATATWDEAPRCLELLTLSLIHI